LQYVKYTNKTNIAKGLAKLFDKKCVFWTKVKNNNINKKKSNIKTLAGTRD